MTLLPTPTDQLMAWLREVESFQTTILGKQPLDTERDIHEIISSMVKTTQNANTKLSGVLVTTQRRLTETYETIDKLADALELTYKRLEDSEQNIKWLQKRVEVLEMKNHYEELDRIHASTHA